MTKRTWGCLILFALAVAFPPLLIAIPLVALIVFLAIILAALAGWAFGVKLGPRE